MDFLIYLNQNHIVFTLGKVFLDVIIFNVLCKLPRVITFRWLLNSVWLAVVFHQICAKVTSFLKKKKVKIADFL